MLIFFCFFVVVVVVVVMMHACSSFLGGLLGGAITSVLSFPLTSLLFASFILAQVQSSHLHVRVIIPFK